MLSFDNSFNSMGSKSEIRLCDDAAYSTSWRNNLIEARSAVISGITTAAILFDDRPSRCR
jgi:hypothetical protein